MGVESGASVSSRQHMHPCGHIELLYSRRPFPWLHWSVINMLPSEGKGVSRDRTSLVSFTHYSVHSV